MAGDTENLTVSAELHLHGLKRAKAMKKRYPLIRKKVINLLHKNLNASDKDAERAATKRDQQAWKNRNEALREILRQL